MGLAVARAPQGQDSSVSIQWLPTKPLIDHLPLTYSSWKTYTEGWPRCLDHATVKDLDLNIKYSAVKNAKFYFKVHSA